MSKREKLEPTQGPRTYLERVVLSSYRSIKSVDVTLKDGLNIIIGKNGSGKSNFLHFLSDLTRFELDNYNVVNSQLFIGKDSQLEIQISKANQIEANEGESRVLTRSIDIGFVKKGHTEIFKDENRAATHLTEFQNSFFSTIISHGVPIGLPILESPYSFSYKGKEGEGERADGFEGIRELITNSKVPYFLRAILIDLYFTFIVNDNISFETVQKSVRTAFSKIDQLAKLLTDFTQITDIKLSDNITFAYYEKQQEVQINNVYLEYKVNGEWYPYASLSDGTKRVLAIIGDVGFTSQAFFFKDIYGMRLYNQSRVIFIEEPELGIHPHQLHMLMNFLKSESEKKQIIITTHSPQVLNVLGRDDLDRIIICEYNVDSGTKLRHMTEDEKSNALVYLDEMFLSDFWLHTDFNSI